MPRIRIVDGVYMVCLVYVIVLEIHMRCPELRVDCLSIIPVRFNSFH